MNEPFKREYGYIYIVTDEDKRNYLPRRLDDELWEEVSEVWESGNNTKTFSSSYFYRRRISAGEGYEIVPPDEVETGDMEYTRDGVVWNSNKRSKTSGSYYFSKVGRYVPTSTMLAFRRKVEVNDEKVWMVINLNTSTLICEAYSLEIARIYAKNHSELSLGNTYIVCETIASFKHEPTPAEVAWEKFDSKDFARFKDAFMAGFNAKDNQ